MDCHQLYLCKMFLSVPPPRNQMPRVSKHLLRRPELCPVGMCVTLCGCTLTASSSGRFASIPTWSPQACKSMSTWRSSSTPSTSQYSCCEWLRWMGGRMGGLMGGYVGRCVGGWISVSGCMCLQVDSCQDVDVIELATVSCNDRSNDNDNIPL